MIRAPYATYGQINRSINRHLASGPLVVWVFEPTFRTVTVYRPDAKPVLFNDDQSVPEHPAMPGFAPAVRELFE